MANFKVGQRVKKVRGDQNVGYVGVVVAVGSYTCPSNPSDKDYDMKVKFDKAWVNMHGRRWPASEPATAKSHNYEPLIPDGYQTTEWDQCLWQPESEKAS